VGVLGLVLLCAAAHAADSAPARIASLNLAADEVLIEILPPERLVSVTRWADDPETSNVAGRVPPSAFRVQKADMEKLVALRPDLVVVSEYTDADFLKLLESSGMRHHRMQGLDSMEGIRTAILDLGRAVGALEAAQRLVSRYDATLREVARKLSGAKRPRVLYWSGTMTAGDRTTISALIECAGGYSVGRELGIQGIRPVGAERAFVADPDAVLVGSWPGAAEGLREHPLLSKLRAVREGRVVVLQDRLLVALSQYTAGACSQLAGKLHPDRFPAIRP
jgi:iron complex transport system substrate-binding protein